MDAYYSGAMSREPDRIDPFEVPFESDLAQAVFLPSDVPMVDDEIVTSVMVEGTTFVAVYGVVDGFIELISPDLGEGRAALAGKPADQVARNLLRKMARDEVLRTEIPFMRDHQLVPKKSALKSTKESAGGVPQASS